MSAASRLPGRERAWLWMAGLAGLAAVVAAIALIVAPDGQHDDPDRLAATATPAVAPSPPVATPSPTATAAPSPAAVATPTATTTPSPTPPATVTPEAAPLVSVSPGGDAVPRLATLKIAFRDPPSEEDGADLVRINPPTEGSFAWADSRTLLFQPEFPGWQRGQRYELLVDASAAGIEDDHPHAFTVEGQLEVAYVIPGAGDSEVPTNAQILVQFNRSVAALTVLQEGPAPQVLEFDPPLAGKGEWLNTSLYRFIPSDLRPSTEYRVRIPAGLTSAADGVLLSDYAWTFATFQPFVTRVYPGDGTYHVEPDAAFVVSFNQPMDRASIEAGIALRRAGDGDTGSWVPWSGEYEPAPSLSFEWNEDDSTATVTPDQPLALNTAYELIVPAGLRGAYGGESRSERVSRFTTISPPKLVRTSPRDGATGAGTYRIRLDYNNPMDSGSFVDRISISGIDSEEIDVDVYYDRAYIYAPLEYLTHYTVKIEAGVRDRGRRPLPAHEFSFTTRARPAPRPWMYLQTPGQFVTWSATHQQELYYFAAHVDKVHFQLHPLTDTEAELLLRRNYIDTWVNRKWTPFVPSNDPLRIWTEEIAEELRGSRRPHSTTLGDGRPLATGDYLLVATSAGGTSKVMLSVVDTTIVTKVSSDELLVWVLDYETGEPLAGAEVETTTTATTDADGLAWFPSVGGSGRHIVRVDSAGHHGTASTHWQQGSAPWQLEVPFSMSRPRLLGHLYTDRPIYRPGETVSFKGVVRHEDDAAYSLPETGTAFRVSIRDRSGKEILNTSIESNELGTIAGEGILPDEAKTGRYYVRLMRDSGAYITSTSFSVAEFRVPEFKVEVEAPRAHYVDGEQIDAEVRARFFFGGPVNDQTVDWAVLSSPARIRVEGYERYSFSAYDRYWWAEVDRPLRAQGSATTDASGDARIQAPAALDPGEGAQEFTISATVTDANAQVVANSTTVTVHPAAWYVGVRPESYIATAGKAARVHLVTVDVEGEIAPRRPISVRFFQREWITTKVQTPGGGRSYHSEPLDTEIEVRTLTTNADGEASIFFTPPRSGSYRIVAESIDEQGRVARSARFLWVSGKQRAYWRVRNDDIIALVADRESYEVGDVAEVLVPTPFEGATGLVTIERGRVLGSEVRVFETNSEVLRIPIEDRHLPNVYVSVVLYRPPTADDPLPRYHVGTVELPVSTAPRRLDVQITPDRERAAPGETVRYEVQVTDWQGRGTASEVSVAIVDQAVLSLADEVGPDGLRAFWFQRPLGVATGSSLAVSVDRRNDVLKEPEPEDLGGKGAAGDATLRSNFKNTALWIGQLTTDENGRASFELTLPDNATTWRAQARAVSGTTQVGEGTSELLVTRPLLVRPALPRFLRVGDEVTLRTLVRNGTASARDVAVTIEVEGVALEGGTLRVARVASDRSAVFEWSARALAAGTATIRFRAAAAGGYGDAVEISLPVHLDVTPETTATGGVVKDSLAVEAVYLPDYVITVSGSLEVSVQGSIVGALDEELVHFRPYPDRYESNITIASRVIASVAVQRGTARGLSTTQRGQLLADLTELISRQRYDSGWGWCRTCSSDPMCTGWVLIALGEARDAGYNVPYDVLGQAWRLITNHVHRRTDVQWPADPNQHAFLLYALTDAANRGDVTSQIARQQAGTMRAIVEQHRAQLTNWGRAYLLLGLLATGHEPDHEAVRTLLNDLTAATVASANGNHWRDGRIAGSMHNGSVRTTALVLRALTAADPQHPLIEETARWLSIARTAQRWKTTVERSQGMAALGAYAQLTGEHLGQYDYEVWVNAGSVLGGDFDVAAGDYRDATSVALADLPLGEVSRVQFERDASGPGRMYYGLNLRYVTPAQDIEALNRGFAVSHRYTLLDKPDEPITSASLGDVVRIEVTVIAPTDRVFAKVEDFLPAGLEPIDPRLKIVPIELRRQLEDDRTRASTKGGSGYYAPWYGWYYSPWDQTDIRDDRVVLLADRLPKGMHVYVYYARATTPGDFFLAPAHAEETFFPEVFGRSDSGRFTVHAAE